MRGVIARPRRRLEKISVRFFALKIFDPPRRPKRFQLSFREFVRHLPREISSQPRLNVSLTPRGLQILLALCCIALVETILPIHELKGSTLLSRGNQPLIMQLHLGWHIPRQANVELMVCV